MTPLLWIIASGLLMGAIALIGCLTLLFREETIEKALLPLVAFASGSLIGGSLFHLLPEAIERLGDAFAVSLWLALGFVTFLLLEQVLQWHHCHRPASAHTHRHPQGYLLLVADSLHNFIEGFSVGASFLVDLRLGFTAWIAAAAHEIPQELGDFSVLIHSGWRPGAALVVNTLSASMFLVGGVLAYFLAAELPLEHLLAFAAGNFLYIGAVDLIPEFKRACEENFNAAYTASFLCGMGILLGVKWVAGE